MFVAYARSHYLNRIIAIITIYFKLFADGLKREKWVYIHKEEYIWRNTKNRIYRGNITVHNPQRDTYLLLLCCGIMKSTAEINHIITIKTEKVRYSYIPW